MKTNLVTDVSPLAYQIINRICGYNGSKIQNVIKQGRLYLQKEEEQLKFLQMFHDEVKKVNNITNILGGNKQLFVFDSIEGHSYRYSIYPEYKKSNSRTKEKPFDKKILKSLMDRYYKDLINNNICAIEFDRLEADDIIAEASSFFPENENLCIVTSDGDMKQLMNNRTFIYNNIDNRIFVTNDFRYTNSGEEKSDEDFFFTEEVDDVAYERFFSEAIVINPKMELLVKIICGDTSDNIGSSFFYSTKKDPNKTFNFTDKRFGQLLESNPEVVNIDFNVKENRIKLYEMMSVIVKRDFDKNKLPIYEKNWEFNNKMMNLSEAHVHHGKKDELVIIMNDRIKSNTNTNLDTLVYHDLKETYA